MFESVTAGTTFKAFDAMCGTNTALPEHPVPEMIPNSNTYSMTNPGHGSAVHVNTLGRQVSTLVTEQIQAFASHGPNEMPPSDAQTLDTIPWDVYSSSSNFTQQQQQPMLHENTQALQVIADGSSDGANETAGPTTPGRFGDTNSDGRTVTLRWMRDDGTQAQAKVLVTDPIYDPMVRKWPTDLQLGFDGVGIRTVDIQSSICKNPSPMARIKCVPGKDSHDFGELVKSLRNRGSTATASCDIEGKYQAQFRFAPLFVGLLCVVMGIPTPPLRHSRRPDCTKRQVVQSSRRSTGPVPLPVPVAIPLVPEQPPPDAAYSTQNAQPQQGTQPQGSPLWEAMGPPQGGSDLFPPCDQAPTVTPVCAESPPHLQPVSQGYTQGPLQLPQPQQSLEVPSQDMFAVESEPDGWPMDTDTPHLVPDSPMPTGPASLIGGATNTWFGIGENDANCAYTDSNFGGANPIGSFTSPNLGSGEDGAIHGVQVVMEATPSPATESGVWSYFDEQKMDWNGQGSGTWI